MDSNSIMNKTFTIKMGGYVQSEVDDYFADVAREMSQLKKENEDLEKKLQVCADKIREYREDEDALKDALLGAQKTGNAIIAGSKEKAADIIREAEDKSAEMRQAADDYVAERKAEGEKIIQDALDEKKRIEDEAKKAADDIHAQMVIQTELDKEVLTRTKREAEDFRTRVIIEYNRHIEFIKKIPEQCFNEFVLNTASNHTSNALRELIAAQQGQTASQIPGSENDNDGEYDENGDEDNSSSGAYDDADGSAESENANDGDDGGNFTVDNAFGSDEEDDEETPEFLKSRPNRNPNGSSKYDKLEFGGNSNNKKKKK